MGVSLIIVSNAVTIILFTIPFILTVGKRSDHLVLPILGCLTYMTYLILFAIGRQVWMIYLAYCIAGLFNILTPVIRSRITKTVEPSEYAVVFILIGISDSGGLFAVSAIANEIYRDTLLFFPGLVYLVFASIGVIAILLMLYVFLIL